MIIGLSGFARSGKDTVADYLVSEYGYTRIAFADPMREALYRLNPMISVHDMTHVPLASAVDGMGWEEVKTASADLRGLLQRMGTEVGREMFGEDVWVKQALRAVSRHENVVFSDVRFKNEADALRELDGQLWRMTRTGVGAANEHLSEHALSGYYFNEEISNDGSLDDLYAKVDDLIGLLNDVKLF